MDHCRKVQISIAIVAAGIALCVAFIVSVDQWGKLELTERQYKSIQGDIRYYPVLAQDVKEYLIDGKITQSELRLFRYRWQCLSKEDAIKRRELDRKESKRSLHNLVFDITERKR